MEKVAQDEQSHIGLGVKLLQILKRGYRLKERGSGYAERGDILDAAVLVSQGWDRGYTEVFGFTLEEIGAEGAM